MQRILKVHLQIKILITLHHYFCAAHTLQLGVEDALKDNNMGGLLKICHSIVTHYNLSNTTWSVCNKFNQGKFCQP